MRDSVLGANARRPHHSNRLLAVAKETKMSETDMSNKNWVRCPDCGNGKLLCLFPKYIEGVTGPPALEIDCDRCSGTGKIPSEMMTWIDVGNQCRVFREIEDMGLREGAIAYGMQPCELSLIECGKVDPTEHAKMFGITSES